MDDDCTAPCASPRLPSPPRPGPAVCGSTVSVKYCWDPGTRAAQGSVHTDSTIVRSGGKRHSDCAGRVLTVCSELQ